MPTRKLVTVVLTFGAMVGLIVYAATRPKKPAPEQERTMREPAPLTEEECKQFGEDFARAVSHQHRASVREALRLREIAERVARDLGLTPAEERELFGNNVTGPERCVSQLLEAVQPDDRYTFRRVRCVNGRWVAVFRSLSPTSGNFFELALTRYADGRIGAADYFDYYHGHTISTMMREVAVVYITARRRKLLDRLTGSERAFAESQKAIQAAAHDLTVGRPKVALTALRALPDQLRDQKSFRNLLFTAAEATGEVTEYFAEYERALARAPEDPALDLRLFGYFIEKNRYEEAIGRLDRVDAAVGGDAYLAGLKASVLKLNGQRERAREVSERAYADEPTIDRAYFVRLAIAVEDKNHTDTLLWLKKGIESGVCDTDAEALAGDAPYADFVKSPQFAEFTKWLAERKK